MERKHRKWMVKNAIDNVMPEKGEGVNKHGRYVKTLGYASIAEIGPLSADVGYVIYEKNDGLHTLHISVLSGNCWLSIVPSYSHIVGWQQVGDLLKRVEVMNYNVAEVVHLDLEEHWARIKARDEWVKAQEEAKKARNEWKAQREPGEEG